MTRRPLAALLADTAAVLLFVTVGRREHAQSSALTGVLVTAWPFLAALAASHLAVRSWRSPASLVPTGVAVWLGTLTLGMVLRRAVAGEGTAPAFVAVATVSLALLLLGWRAGVHLRRRAGQA